MNVIVKVLVVITIVVLGAVGFAYSGLYNVSASSPHSGVATWYLSTVSRHSIMRQARDIPVPDLTNDALLRAGISDFDAMCVACHGAPGIQPAAVGRGLNPAAPDLTQSAIDMSPAELFWVTRNGVRMTGMPAWGATHDDEAIWPVVAFMTKLPSLDAERYRSLLGSATGAGHHAGDDRGRHDHSETEASSTAQDSNAGSAASPSAADHENESPAETPDHHDHGHDHKH